MKKRDGISIRETLAIHLRAAKEVQHIAKWFFPAVFLSAAVNAIVPYVTIWFSAQLINELAGARRMDVLLQWVIWIVGITAALELLRAVLKRWENSQEAIFNRTYSRIYTEKFLTMDFASVDDQKTRDLFTQIHQNSNWGGWGYNYLPMYVSWGTDAIFGIAGAVALTVSLFTQRVPDTAGAFTVLNHPLFIVALIAVMLGLIAFRSMLNKRYMAGFGKLADVSRFGNRVFAHFGTGFCQDMDKALDIRMYDQTKIAEHYRKTVNVFGVGSVYAKFMCGFMGIGASIGTALSQILTGVVYLFVCLKAWAGAFGIGSVTQYVGAVTALASNVTFVFTILNHMQSNAGFLKTSYEFLDIPNSMYQGSLTTEKRADRQYKVEFRDVSFKYPGSDVWALRHVNMKFKIGSRLAIVGENGSGKTTFIKLLCRLYDPQEGQILLNGIDIRKYRYDDYMKIFSVVFQDFKLISQPLGANVAGSVTYDRARAEKALVDAGFGDRLTSMPHGLDTMLYKDLSEEGVEVSGGEAQKIAIARALYKDAPFIILDEPTAALDPIAEAEIYAKFSEISGDRTAIYISHRLSSCKFCDEIAVFQDGQVIQQGSHDALLADENGRYHTLWQAQAQYYTE